MPLFHLSIYVSYNLPNVFSITLKRSKREWSKKKGKYSPCVSLYSNGGGKHKNNCYRVKQYTNSLYMAYMLLKILNIVCTMDIQLIQMEAFLISPFGFNSRFFFFSFGPLCSFLFGALFPFQIFRFFWYLLFIFLCVCCCCCCCRFKIKLVNCIMLQQQTDTATTNNYPFVLNGI